MQTDDLNNICIKNIFKYQYIGVSVVSHVLLKLPQLEYIIAFCYNT